jgi:large conductance mechanosensitive channel
MRRHWAPTPDRQAFGRTGSIDLAPGLGILGRAPPAMGEPRPRHHTEETEPMSFASEFRQFALKGNVIDLAVGVIIGAAFGKIVDSLVSDVIMPIVGRVFGGLDFSSYYVALAGQAHGLPLAEAKKLGAVLAYGNYITVAINFVILAFIIFVMVRQINRLKAEAPAPAAPPEEVMLLRQIRDALRK